MITIDNLSSDSNQLTQILLPDGSAVVINLIYRPAIQRWTIDLLWNDFEADGMNVCIHPNFLREYRNTIGFGIGCTTTDGADPVYIDDFSDGRATLLVLDPSDVALIEKILTNV